MADPDRDVLSELASSIADGADVTWPDAGSPGASGGAPLVEQLKVIAQVAAAHRAAWTDEGAESRTAPAAWAGLSIIEKIGEGRFGTVYRAVDPRLQRQVALKLLHAPASSDQAAPTAVINEARLLARIHHPNVVTVHGAECSDGRVGIWTEFIEGRTLEAILQEHGPLTSDEAAAIGVDVCHALAAMHAAGLVHRDVKAQNIMRDARGRVVLVDFGTVHDAARLAGMAVPAGTPLYMAPELFAGGQPSVASDIYAVAVLLYRLLTGGYPVDGDSTNAIKAAHAEGCRTSLRDSGVDVPAALASAIERGLAPNPNDRFPDVHQFADALRPRGRRSLGWLTAGLAAAAVVTLSVWAWSGTRSPSDVPELLCRDCVTTSPMSVAADGRTAVVDDYDSGDLLVHDLATGRRRRLQAKRGDWGDSRDYAEAPVLSRDATLVAYRWMTARPQDTELRIMPLRSGSSPIVSAAGATSMTPLDWRPDHKQILVTRRQGTSWELAWIGVNDRVVTRIRSFDPSPNDPVRSARVSPDGRQIVYGLARGRGESHLFLIDADGSHDRRLVTTAAINVGPVWTPDGLRVVYSSNAGETIDLWSIAVAPNGTAWPIRQNLGRHRALALTPEGRYIYEVDLPSIPLTFLTAVSTSLEEPGRLIGTVHGSSPSWSPDGQHLAVFRDSPTENGMVLVVRTGEDQSEHVYTHRELRDQALWADSDSLLVTAGAGGQPWSMQRVNHPDGVFTQAVAPSSSTFRLAVAAVSPDGQKLYIGGRDADDPDGRTNRLIEIDLPTGDERSVAPMPSPMGGGSLGLAVSPSGGTLAVLMTIGPEGFVRLVNIRGGDSRQLVGPFPAVSAFGKIAWTRDDRIWYGESLYTKASRDNWRIMRIPASGGTPTEVLRINGKMIGTARFAVSPDSSQIAWTAHGAVRQTVSDLSGPKSEVWSTDLRSALARRR